MRWRGRRGERGCGDMCVWLSEGKELRRMMNRVRVL